MKRIEISVNGKTYPCMPTMGAMLRFKTLTGRDVTQMEQGVTDTLTYLYCCVQSACDREKKKFGLTLMEFADAVTDEDVNRWATTFAEDASGGSEEEKKKALK